MSSPKKVGKKQRMKPKPKVGRRRRRQWTPPPPETVITISEADAPGAEWSHWDYRFPPPPPDPLPTEIRTYLDGLRFKAENASVDAVHHLVELATAVITHLNALSEKTLATVQSAAVSRHLWPVLDGLPPSIARNNRRNLEAIKLKRPQGFGIDPSSVGIDAPPVKQWAWELLNLVNLLGQASYDSELQSQYFAAMHMEVANPAERMRIAKRIIRAGYEAGRFEPLKFTEQILDRCGKTTAIPTEPEIAHDWWDVALDIFMLNTNGHPELIPELREIGEHRRFHPYTKEEVEFLGEDVVAGKQQIKNIVSEICDRIREQFAVLYRQLLSSRD